jgi:hypothetical protein
MSDWRRAAWFGYWLVALGATTGVVLSVVETAGHSLGGAVLAGTGMAAMFLVVFPVIRALLS